MRNFIMSLLGCAVMLSPGTVRAQSGQVRFHALVLYENGGHHIEFSRAGQVWLDKLAADSSFTLDYSHTTDSINTDYLGRYQLIIQLDYAPYGWKPTAAKAFQAYIQQGRGGWIGFHHATLLGEFDGFPMWDWFSDFMGGIRYTDYIPGFASARVKVEDRHHPVMKNVPPSFTVNKDEWYSYNKSPRPNVRVLAHVDESTYRPDSNVKMGDHPVIWINEKVAARNVYVFMGHSPELYANQAWMTVFRNAIFWAAAKK